MNCAAGVIVVSMPLIVIGCHVLVCQLKALNVPVEPATAVSPRATTRLPGVGELMAGVTSCALDCAVFTAIASMRVVDGNCARNVYVAAPRKSSHTGPPYD